MSRKSIPTQMTPQIQEVINRWNYFANKNGIRLAPTTVISDMAFKAKANLDYGGACVCLPYDRPICPCPQCLTEIKRDGLCF